MLSQNSYLLGKKLAGFIVFVLITLLIMPAAWACSGCTVNYPFLHSFPSDEELTQATANFVQQYSANMLDKQREISIGEQWHIKLEKPGIEEQYNIIEVILCFKEELKDAGTTQTSYNFTMLAYDEDTGYYFWPYSMGSFPQREDLDAYIEEYVISRLKDQSVVQLPGPDSSKVGKTAASWVIIKALFILLSLTLVFFWIKAKKKPALKHEQKNKPTMAV